MPPRAPVISTRALMRSPASAGPGVRWVSSKSAGSKAAVRRRKRQVQSGHSVALRPVSSRYQLAQPVFQTVPSMRSSRSALKRSAASARTCTVSAPWRSM